MDLKQVLRDVALVQQSVRAEQHREAIAAMQSQQREHQARQDQQMRQLLAMQAEDRAKAENRKGLKQLMFALRQEAQRAAETADAAQKCFALLGVKAKSDRLDASLLEDLSDKQWHSETCALIAEGLSATAAVLGEDAQEVMGELHGALLRLCSAATEFVKYDAQLQGKHPRGDQTAKWNAMHDTVASTVNEAVGLASRIPAMSLDAFPLGKAVAAARTGILDPISTGRFSFKCLILVAKADGRVESAEAELLCEIGARHRMAREDVHRLIQETRSVHKSEFAGDQEAAERIVRNLYRCAAVDGRVADREDALIRKIGSTIGVPAGVLNRIAGGEGMEHAITIVDPQSVMAKFTASLVNRDRKKVYVGAAIPADLLRVMSSVYSADSEEVPLIAGDWKPLGMRTHSMLLTNRSLYLFFAAAKNTEKVSILDILSFRAGALTGKMVLRGGITLNTPNAMNGVLQALVQAIAASKRHV